MRPTNQVLISGFLYKQNCMLLERPHKPLAFCFACRVILILCWMLNLCFLLMFSVYMVNVIDVTISVHSPSPTPPTSTTRVNVTVPVCDIPYLHEILIISVFIIMALCTTAYTLKKCQICYVRYTFEPSPSTFDSQEWVGITMLLSSGNCKYLSNWWYPTFNFLRNLEYDH